MNMSNCTIDYMKHATMTILGLNHPMYPFSDLLYYLAFLLIFMNPQIMKI